MKRGLKFTAVVLVMLSSISLLAAPGSAEADYGKKSGVLPDFVFGPKITALGTPVPFRVGAETKWDNFLGASFDWGFLPSLSFSNVSVKLNGWNFAARLYPWKGAFYAGVAFGSQTFTGAQTGTVVGVPTTVTLTFNSTYLAPQVGWRWVWDSGFFLGMELGVQIPISTSSSVTSDNELGKGTPAYAQLQSQINDKATTFGNNPLPHFALLQLGYFF